jgi:hypothetical protein
MDIEARWADRISLVNTGNVCTTPMFAGAGDGAIDCDKRCGGNMAA